MGSDVTRAALYLRQSLDAAGDGLAVARQRQDCLKIAKERGWQVVAEYVDNSISASDKNKARPGYDRLLADYTTGAFEALIVWDLDRLTRQPRQLEDWIDAAETTGLRLVTANGEADLSTDGGRLYARIKASVARSEVERKSARQRRAAAQRADLGRPPLGPRLTGYTTTGEIVEEEAAVVRRVFARFVAGDSIRSLTVWLNDAGVPTRHGGRWNPSSVRDILRNPRYAGHAIYNGKPTGKAGGWPALVDAETFAVTQSVLSDPRRKSNGAGTHRKYLGSGLYLCGKCDAPVCSWSAQRYRCVECGMTRAQAQIDARVLAVVRARLAQPDLADLLPAPDAAAAREIADKTRAVQDRLARFEADYDAGLIDGRRFKVATDKAAAELAALDTRRARLGAGAGIAGEVLAAPDPVHAFDSAPLMIQRGVVAELVVVRLFPGVRGRKTFDPASVEITPRTT